MHELNVTQAVEDTGGLVLPPIIVATERPATADLRSPEDAVQLQQGQLAVPGWGIVEFGAETVTAAANFLLQTGGDTRGLTSQAEVIARAGSHGWGRGDYSAV